MRTLPFLRVHYRAELLSCRSCRVELDSDGTIFTPYLYISYGSWTPSTISSDRLQVLAAPVYSCCMTSTPFCSLVSCPDLGEEPWSGHETVCSHRHVLTDFTTAHVSVMSSFSPPSPLTTPSPLPTPSPLTPPDPLTPHPSQPPHPSRPPHPSLPPHLFRPPLLLSTHRTGRASPLAWL